MSKPFRNLSSLPTKYQDSISSTVVVKSVRSKNIKSKIIQSSVVKECYYPDKVERFEVVDMKSSPLDLILMFARNMTAP